MHAASDSVHTASDGGRRTADTAPPPAATGSLAAVRAQEMAAYSERLLAPYVRRIEEQAERVGRLELELEQARARVAELELIPIGHGHAQTQNGLAGHAASEWPERRRWWQRLMWG